MADELESPSPSPVSSTSSKSEPKTPSSPGSLSSSSSTSTATSSQSTSQIAAAMQALLSSQPNASQLAAALHSSHFKDLSQLSGHESLAASLLHQIQSGSSPKSSSRKPQPHKRAKCDDNSDGAKSDKVKSEIDDEEEYDLHDYDDQLDEERADFDEEETPGRHRADSLGSPTRSSSSQDQSRSISPSTVFNESNNGYTAASNPGMDSLLAAGLGYAPNSSLLTSAAAAAGSGGPLTNDLNSLLHISDSNAANAAAAAALMSSAGLPAPANSVASLIASTRKRRTDRDAAAERVKKIKPVPDDKKDDAYWERRRKNNEAAKRSRDLRRMKEDEIAVRASFLEQENLKLKAQVTILKAELSKLHFMLYNR